MQFKQRRKTYKSRQISRHTWHFASDSVPKLLIEDVAILGELRTRSFVAIRLSYSKNNNLVEHRIAKHYRVLHDIENWLKRRVSASICK